MPEETKTETPPSAAEEPGFSVEIEKEPQRRPPVGDEDLNKLTAVNDDEISSANEQAKKAVKGLRTAYQEQRRRAEQWSRDAATASNLADQLYRENQELRQTVTRSEAALIDQALTRTESQLEHAKSKLRAAHSSGDADLIVSANEEMARSVAESDRLKLLKPAASAGAAREVTVDPAAPPPARSSAPVPPNARTNAWTTQNAWFGFDPARHDVEMSEYAMRQHRHMAVDGITEENNPELYWRTIEEKLGERYPEKFKSSTARPTEGHARPVAVTGATRSNGAASSPSAGGKRTVRLTESMVRLAARLNLSPEQYAAQLVKEEEQEKSGTTGRVQ